MKYATILLLTVCLLGGSAVAEAVEGLNIRAVMTSDNPDVNEGEPETLLTALIHAREVATPEDLFYYMDYLTDNYATAPDAQYLAVLQKVGRRLCRLPGPAESIRAVTGY